MIMNKKLWIIGFLIPMVFFCNDVVGITSNDNADTTLVRQPSPLINFTLKWDFANKSLYPVDDICDVLFGVTFYIVPVGLGIGTRRGVGNRESDDILDRSFGAWDCPKNDFLRVSNMIDGKVYDVNLLIYMELTVNIPLKVSVVFKRGNSTLDGTYSFPISDPVISYVTVLRIERNGDVVTIRDISGMVIGEG